MGFMTPELPDVDRETWPTLPRATQLQVVTRHWAERGFGTPYAVYLLYLLKIAVYVAAPAAIVSLRPRPRQAGPDRRLVDPTHRVPEGDDLHPALRSARLRLRVPAP